MRLPSVAAIALAAVLAVAVTACSAGTSPSTSASTTTAKTGSPRWSITVFAAASLTATFTELAKRFEAEYPGVSVKTSFAGSSELVAQISAGAPADVFASADTATMAKLTTASLVAGAPVNFATNVLEIAVPPNNPAAVRSFADLARPGTKTVICAPVVPCGAATLAVEKSTGVALSPVSEENSVTDVLGKVSSGEADAGVVYVTDVKAAGSSVRGIAIPRAKQSVNTYPIAVLKQAANPTTARAFDRFVTGPIGRSVLAAAGFGAP
jgi:molybdate transport system substrate-binding protein